MMCVVHKCDGLANLCVVQTDTTRCPGMFLNNLKSGIVFRKLGLRHCEVFFELGFVECVNLK